MKNKILMTLVTINAIVLLLAILFIDSESLIPAYTGIVSGTYLLLFVSINARKYGKE